MFRDLKHQYANFMQGKIKKYANGNGLKVLVSGFIDNYYMAVCQNTKQNLKYTLIVENIKQPLTVELNTYLNQDSYHVCNLYQLTNQLPNKIIQKLMDRGLYKTPNLQRKNTSSFAIHRLVCCIGYMSINNTTIHHINKNKTDNDINNLTPISLSVNIFLDTIDDYNHMLLAGRMFKDIVDDKIKKEINKHRYSVASNGNLHKDIIEYKQQHQTKEVVNKFKQYIRTPQAIRDIINYYFYVRDFIKELA